MMGSGKSTISKVLSKQCAMKLIDTDNLIENHSNMKIKDIFMKRGAFFRDLEEKNNIKNNAIIGIYNSFRGWLLS